jgi:hypothetical protein
VSASVVETGRTRVSVRLRRRAPWIGGLLLAAGIVAAIVAFAPNRNPAPEVFSKTPPKVPVKEKSVPLGASAKSVARQFVKTAVGRHDLAAAWKISGPNIRGGLSHAEWMTGNIPVVPYPIESLKFAPFKLDYSYRNEALLEVAMLPKAGAKIKSQLFFLQLKRIVGPGGKRHWVVDNWVPKSSALVPRGND